MWPSLFSVDTLRQSTENNETTNNEGNMWLKKTTFKFSSVLNSLVNTEFRCTFLDREYVKPQIKRRYNEGTRAGGNTIN